MQDDALPLISVIVPVYNVEPYLRRCLDSIAAQTYRNLEVLVIDDGSPDGCPAICDSYAELDARFRVIHQENSGLSAARNAGLDAMHGAYVAFVDSDDFIAPAMIEALYSRIVADQSSLAICGLRYVDEHGAEIPHVEENAADGVWDERAFWENVSGRCKVYCVVAWNKLYPAALFEGLRYDVGKYFEDEFILHKIISRCGRISCLGAGMYFYMRLEGGISAQNARTIRRLDAVEALISRAHYLQDRGFPALAQNALINCIWIFVNVYLAAPNMSATDKRRFRALHRDFRAARLAIAQGKVERRVQMDLLTFDMGVRFYLVTRALRSWRKQLARRERE